MGISLKVEGVIATTHKYIVEDLRDRVRTRWAVKVNRIIVSRGCSEDVVFDDKVTVLRDTATPDMLAAVVGGWRLTRTEDISEYTVGHNQRRISCADTAQVSVV
ncbi:hypothetical protein ES707_22905 [subsurface metagenome]